MNFYFARRIEAGQVYEAKRRPLTANESGVWLLATVQDTTATSRIVLDAFPVFASYNTRKQRTDALNDFSALDEGATVYESDSQTFYRYVGGVWEPFVPVAPPLDAVAPPPTVPGLTLSVEYSLPGDVPAEYAAYWNNASDTPTVPFVPGTTVFVPFAPSQVNGAQTLTIAVNAANGDLIILGFIEAFIPDITTRFVGGVSFEETDAVSSLVGKTGIFDGVIGGVG